VASLDGASGLYEDCLGEACCLVARRLEQAIVRANPWSSGLLLARLRALDEGAALDLAPAVVRDGALATGVPVMSIQPGSGDAFSGAPIDPHDLASVAGRVDVALAGLPPATGVPAVSLVVPPPTGGAGELAARLELLMPDLHYEALAARWPEVAPGTRRSYVVLRADA
jgi:hypothetical protein